MADNVTAPATGLIFATDELTGAVHWPYAKLAWGADGAAVPVADANGARLPVRIGEALPAGANNIGIVDLSAASLAALETVTVGGTVALDAATLAALEAIQAMVTGTVELGATSLAALETIGIGAALPAGNNNIGDVDVASVPRIATTTRAYGPSLRIATSGAASVRSTAIAATEVTLIPTVDGFVRIGDAAVEAANAAGSFPVFAGVPWTEQITSGQFVAFIRAGSIDGALFIRPVA